MTKQKQLWGVTTEAKVIYCGKAPYPQHHNCKVKAILEMEMTLYMAIYETFIKVVLIQKMHLLLS